MDDRSDSVEDRQEMKAAAGRSAAQGGPLDSLVAEQGTAEHIERGEELAEGLPMGEAPKGVNGQDEATPLVSIIVPVYNVEEFLDKSIRSALTQTYRHIELILVDDESPDDCPKICDRWAEQDGRVQVIHQSNGGVSAARNAGLQEARGEYIYFMDPDDEIEENLVERCLSAMDNTGADLVMFQFDTIGESGAQLESSYKHNDYDESKLLTPQEAIKLQIQSEINGYFWAFLAPRATYVNQNFSFPVGRKIEDMARICNIIGESKRILRIPDVLYHYRLRSGSAMGIISASNTSDWFQAAEDREDYIRERYPELKSYVALQTLNVLGNTDFETIRQNIVYGLNIDPESRKKFKNRVQAFLDDLEGADLSEKVKAFVDIFRSDKEDAPDSGLATDQAASR
ncbi:glycosyltransferase family 2 protein [Bifidobacterium crudilactis]|jgi:glycosyltransferase involved in cell wall biosynthesis|nr:glycosyltransferase family 2 protein [Bifidobacterium crudilactis]MCI1868117.1 glycosyltransferase family 2 protein [Bifidobacterium crudilactis]MDN5971467.1 glycosyltransferase family 2 protein [Bifidobacterium crudilactis]MDN6001239.1 glycosyltransferase family 2 protein [Bifidobacterium crudilactis]MDN6208734.1 glycosyltransferase family 2 protein [Bifidobacterium crudilactis]MDN6458493.1 glycosyltransferase family 2 protein [Bifidobacterium crudilactis]